MEMANTTDLLLCSFGSVDVPPYALHTEAPSQLHLCGPTVFITIEFSIWRFLSSSTLFCCDVQQATYSSTTGLFVLTLKWCFALVELFLFFFQSTTDISYPRDS